MSIYNEDELVPPTWIDRVFLEKVLRQYENNENVKITDFVVSPASMKGDHFASIMFRCKVCYNCDNASKQKSLIIKTMPTEDGHKRELLKESKLFETEISMYAEALPKIHKVLDDCGEPTKLSAEIIYHSLEPHKLIIFEDLCESGYVILRERYLTEDEIKLIYRKIAKLHAASYVLGRSEDHECVTKYEEGIFCNSTLMAMDMMSSGIGYFKGMLAKHEEFKVYLEKIETMEPEIKKNCRELFKSYQLNRGQGKDIYVLNHGDFHMKNMMFKFNAQQQMEDVIMVDYQISCYAPSNIDMAYSQYMLLSPELRLKSNELLCYYFEEFIRMLKQLNVEGELPRYSDFKIAALKYRHFSVFLMTTFLALVRAILVPTPEELKETDVGKFVENPETTATAFDHPDFVEDMRHFLPIMLIDGYLD